MTPPILVTGGSGTLGRLVVQRLLDTGYTVRVMSRRNRESTDRVDYVVGDLLKNEGIDAAANGTEIIVHLAGGPRGDDEATGHLTEAAARSGAQHLVYISVIGADRVPLKWMRSKLGAEQAVTGSGVPWTTLRSAQFHELTFTMVQKLAKMPVIPVPGGLRLQPVDARDVADRLVELAVGQPAGLVPDIAGPRVYLLGELIRGYLRARGSRRPMIPVRIPGKVGRAYRAGDNLTLDGALVGARTWENFLSERLS